MPVFVCLLETGHVHGGAVASALDNVLANIVSRNFGFSQAGILTMELKVKYRGPIPLRKQLHLNTKVVHWKGRKVRQWSVTIHNRCYSSLFATHCRGNKVANEAQALSSSGVDTIICLCFVRSLGSSVR